MTKFNSLIKILDVIRTEAPKSMPKIYALEETDEEKINQARARAFIHLFLKVSFGLLDFQKREHFITDGSYDGGIDGYYIKEENKTIYFIQSKFRTSSENFESKEIKLSEILTMDINRILDGEDCDEDGNQYNGKIKQLQREVSNTSDIARYSYQVVILANLSSIKPSDLRRLTGGLSCEVFDYSKSYEKLVFPVLSGTFFNASDLKINIDLSNKNAGSKISYKVLTKKGECEITVLFVPTIELGRIMYTYKNSILKYNPRSYLGHEGKKVNDAIKQTIIEKDTNEFALFNNGITMLSDETNINERIGQKNKAQLIVKNPQIINGGQTSFTLSRIYEENVNGDVEHIFQNKEVLLKIITLLTSNEHESKLELIEEISTATNQQTPVIVEDRLSNDKIQMAIQKNLFERYGLLYERKRGEFADGIYNKYISENEVIERNLFFRMYCAANGEVSKAMEKKLFLNQTFNISDLSDFNQLDNTYFGYLSFKRLSKLRNSNQRVDLPTYAKVYAMVILHKPMDIKKYELSADLNTHTFISKWKDFIDDYKNKNQNQRQIKNRKTGEIKTNIQVNYKEWFDSPRFKKDLLAYFQN